MSEIKFDLKEHENFFYSMLAKCATATGITRHCSTVCEFPIWQDGGA